MAVENYVAQKLGRRLERGQGLRWPELAMPVTRRIALPDVPVVAIGGALLGGSGRTPLALAIAEWLTAHGRRVAFVGHGHGARSAVRMARRVEATDDARAVGDEAVLALRRLHRHGVTVWVGPREHTLQAAAAEADLLVVDGLLQTSPTRVALSVLALSAPNPWGAGVTFPRGDLRARPARLAAEADHVVLLSEEDHVTLQHAPHAEIARTELHVPAVHGRYGVLLGLARPERMVAALARRGIHGPVLTAADHRADAAEARARRMARTLELDGFYVTAKCDAALGRSTLPRAVLELRVTLPSRLREALARLTHPTADVAPCLAEREASPVSP